MKTIELTGMMGKTVNESQRRPLSEAEQRLYAAIWQAVKAYQEKIRSQIEPCVQLELVSVDAVSAFGMGRLQRLNTAKLIKMVRWAVNAMDRKPVSEAEQDFFGALHQAVMAYEDHVRLGQPAPERRCMICEVPLSQCCC